MKKTEICNWRPKSNLSRWHKNVLTKQIANYSKKCDDRDVMHHKNLLDDLNLTYQYDLIIDLLEKLK